MIYGIGTDILDIKRIAYLYERYGDALPRRILHEDEWVIFSGSQDKIRFLAKRFAAKEAFSKAVGTGIREPVSLRHIAVAHNELGKPEFVCAPELRFFLSECGIHSVHLSLSDEKDCVLAFAIAEAA
ncbi:MAG: holo-ACP synthase [Alysiella sp.]|uniref:holo-ACP synthase n=1 Tax=Alysiella sp. TaxID=1872483 RepID=UPI0026DCE60A|nr:holo-ACP synthase [Alysiella sp.]MDO4434302.1 holo-ACP synthase [Alysiella sp.]